MHPALCDHLTRLKASVDFYDTIKNKSFAETCVFYMLNSILLAVFRNMSN